MFSSKKSIIFFLLLLVSCGEKPTNQEQFDANDIEILSKTDSILSIVDDQFEEIIHNRELQTTEVNELQNTVSEYESTLVNDQRIQNELNRKIDLLINSNKEKDSTINILNLTIESISYRVERLESKIKINQDKTLEERAMYESIIYRLEDSIKISNEKIEFLLEFISEGTKPIKGFRGEEYDYLYKDSRQYWPPPAYYPATFEVEDEK